jgi:N-methylhydantoinase B/oxoprolinase/acetone carboxylase alpha subunit
VLSAVTLNGLDDGGKPYVFTFFSSGGMGARAGKNGLDATAFPSNVANVPIEVMEQSVPVLITQRELIKGSAGNGAYRGGAGQRIGFSLRTKRAASVSCMVERTESAPRGFGGGDAGRSARVLLDGKAVDPKHAHALSPGQSFVLETPGGGGYGASTEVRRHAKEGH